ncbi:MAG: hypothetical protein ABFD46_03370 [Armatimonadota bacterium]
MPRFISVASAILLACMICSGCSNQAKSSHSHIAQPQEHKHGHKSAHGGTLNAIVTCENGHAEVKLSGEKLQLWFVSGGHNTGMSVRIPDSSIRLQVKTNEGMKTLVLSPSPLDLAGEKAGDCSYFEGNAPWLKGLSEFTADGQITFKRKKTPLRIEYPKGYDPD